VIAAIQRLRMADPLGETQKRGQSTFFFASGRNGISTASAN
jgi:hypothetical protein